MRPQQILRPNTTYDVVIFGTINGAAFEFTNETLDVDPAILRAMFANAV